MPSVITHNVQLEIVWYRTSTWSMSVWSAMGTLRKSGTLRKARTHLCVFSSWYAKYSRMQCGRGGSWAPSATLASRHTSSTAPASANTHSESSHALARGTLADRVDTCARTLPLDTIKSVRNGCNWANLNMMSTEYDVYWMYSYSNFIRIRYL